MFLFVQQRAMTSLPDIGQTLEAFRLPDAPRLTTRALHKSTLSLTELRGRSNHGMTSSVPYDEAFLVQLRLRDCPRCEYFCGERHLEGVDHRAGVIQIHDLRRDPRVDLIDPFHIVHLYLPLKVLNGLADETGAAPIDELLVRPGDCLRDAALRHLFEAIRPSLARPQEASAVFVDHVALAIGAYVANTYGGVPATNGRVLRGGLAPWQERLSKELLDADLGGNMPLSWLAQQCGLSVRHFTRAFRQSTGVPPHRYLLKRRVEQAQQLLLDHALSLSDVALACGFADQSHFTRVFSASLSMSPGTWRRAHVSRPLARLFPVAANRIRPTAKA